MKQRYVVIAPQGLGDSLEATPLLQALRTARPEATIEVVTLRRAAEALFSGLPTLVDRVRYLPYWERGVLAFAWNASALPLRGRAEASFLTFPSARAHYAILTGLIRAKARYTHDYPEARRLVGAMPNVHVVPIAEKHNVLRNIDLLHAAGIEAGIPTGYVVPRAWIDERPRDRRLVVVHVGSIAHDGLDLRRWPEPFFAELGRRLVARNLDIAIVSGPAEREASERVRDAVPGARLLEAPLDEIARLLSRAAIVVANDNGIAHLAAGVGTPVVSLFGPTPLFHAPYGAASTPLRPSACPPCFDPLERGLTCVRDIDYRCLKQDLTVDLVERTVTTILSKSGAETIPSAT